MEALVRLCDTREGRARMLSFADVREALREPQGGLEDGWTAGDMIAVLRTGKVRVRSLDE